MMGEATRRREAHFRFERMAKRDPFLRLMGDPMNPGPVGGLLADQLRPRHKSDKGKKGGSCNREVCQAPGANWYNRGSLAYYRAVCARWLNKDSFNKRNAERLFGGPLCVEDRPTTQGGEAP